MNELLKKTKCFLLDLDGTIYDDDDVIDGRDRRRKPHEKTRKGRLSDE